MEWESGTVKLIDKEHKFAFITSPSGDVYVHASTPGFPTLVKRGKKANVSFVAQTAKSGKVHATKLRFEQQAPASTYWCQHTDCHDSVDCFGTQAAVEQHMRDVHGYSDTTVKRTFDVKMKQPSSPAIDRKPKSATSISINMRTLLEHVPEASTSAGLPCTKLPTMY